MSMTREQAIQQLKSLRAHCDSMFDDNLLLRNKLLMIDWEGVEKEAQP